MISVASLPPASSTSPETDRAEHSTWLINPVVTTQTRHSTPQLPSITPWESVYKHHSGDRRRWEQSPDFFFCCWGLFVCLFFGFSETGFLCIALAVLELTLQTRLAWNSEIRLSLPPKCWD